MDGIASAQRYLYRIGGPLMIVLGSVSCISSLLIFTQKKLRNHPCSIYLSAVNIADILFIYSMIFTVTLSIGFNIDLSSYNLVSCRLSIYLTFLFDSLSSFYLILASIDRVLVTSTNALTRQRSTRRFANLCLTAGTLFWILFHMHALILSEIIPIGPDQVLCLPSPGFYSGFIGYYLLLVKGILVPLVMGIFGLWTVRNVQNVRHRRIAPAFTVTGQVTGVKLVVDQLQRSTPCSHPTDECQSLHSFQFTVIHRRCVSPSNTVIGANSRAKPNEPIHPTGSIIHLVCTSLC